MKSSFYSKSVQLSAMIIFLLMSLPLMAKEKAVFGEFVVDSNGCISEEVFVYVRSSGESSKARVTVSVYREDVCRDQALLALKAKETILKNGELKIDEKLSEASLNGIVTVAGKSARERYQIKLNLTWKSVGDLVLAEKNRDMTELASDEDEEDKLSRSDKFKVAYRDAAARGSIEVNGEKLTFGDSRGAYLVAAYSKEIDND